MRVDDRVRKAIVFVGHAGVNSFVAHGTGFIVVNFIDDAGFQTLVTTRHVIENIPGKRIDVRLNTHGGEARITSAPKKDWVFHPDHRIDVAVCPSGLPKDQFDIMHFPLEGDLIPPEPLNQTSDIGVGDEVFVPGMYIARLGETKNIPIIRIGTIAAMPEEKLRTKYGYHDAYLIEMRSIDGLSGSPVFAHLLPVIHMGAGQIGHPIGPPQYLIGMLLGHNQVSGLGDTIEIVQQNGQRAKSERIVADVPLNTGIGVVIPISAVIEAVTQPAIHQRRIDQMQEKATEQRQFVPDSARKENEAPAADENPRHREDFNRLLSAAVRKRKQDD